MLQKSSPKSVPAAEVIATHPVAFHPCRDRTAQAEQGEGAYMFVSEAQVASLILGLKLPSLLT